MSTEPPRRRVRRAAQTRHVLHAAPESQPAPPLVPETTAAPIQPRHDPVVDALPSAASLPSGPAPDPAQELDPEPPGLSASPILLVPGGDAGSWLPAGIVLMVMAGLLLCAGLVLIASRQ
ncbi:MAG: hypothetical protein H0U10_09960 [Chloroflexia bacterium]|nr:hypothetical protein [Chloroflexia bacterium]